MRKREHHGMHETPVYRVWQQMRQRCTNPKNHKFHRYGGRGITICARWDSFATFAADMGPRPAGASIDRIDNNKGYSPDNCRWATRLQQQRNTSTTRFVTIGGVTKSISEWAAQIGISSQAFTLRVEGGWPEEKLLSPKYAESVRRGRRMLTHAGETMSVSDWARRIGANHQTLHERLRAGFTVEEALTRRIAPHETRRGVG